MSGVLRAWVAAHDGVVVAATIVGTSLATCLYAYRTVVPLGGPPIPVWFLYPGVVAMLCALTTHHPLPAWQVARRRRLVAARGCWALVVSGFACLCAAFVQTEVAQPGLVFVTFVLVAATWGLAAAIGRASVALGGLVCVLTLAFSLRLRDLTPALVVADLGVAGTRGAVAVALLLLLTYAFAGCSDAYGPCSAARRSPISSREAS